MKHVCLELVPIFKLQSWPFREMKYLLHWGNGLTILFLNTTCTLALWTLLHWTDTMHCDLHCTGFYCPENNVEWIRQWIWWESTTLSQKTLSVLFFKMWTVWNGWGGEECIGSSQYPTQYWGSCIKGCTNNIKGTHNLNSELLPLSKKSTIISKLNKVEFPGKNSW